jgi:hypothetical protein
MTLDELIPPEEAARPAFSVYQFFDSEDPDAMHERVRTFVPLAEAKAAAKHYTTNVAVKMGITKRVIITDSGDLTIFEWKASAGITYPPGGTL